MGLGRRARNGLLALVWLSACGAKARDARPLPPLSSGSPDATSMAPAAPPPPPPFASLEALASRQVRLAPGMREIARSDVASSVPLPKVTHDTCVRIAFAASDRVKVSLVGKDGVVLAGPVAASDGVVGERGPVCFHAENEPHVEVGGDAGGARVVVWEAL